MYEMFTNKRGIPPGYIRKFWLIMRLTTVILIATFMQVSAAGFAQKITLSKRNEPLEKVIKDLRRLSGFNFIATESVLDRAEPVTIEVKNVEFEKVLDRIFEDQKIDYVIEGRTVTLKRKEKSYFETVIDRFQAIDVRGKVVDSLGSPIIGATVSVKGEKKSTITNSNGEFFFTGIDEKTVFVVSFLGYVTKEQQVQKDYNYIRLMESTSKLDEVQIQAYGTTTRRLSTGNISTVKAKDIENNVVSDPILALKGKIPGMTITELTGVPGGNVKINIRGYNSFKNGTEPLVLVDGIPFDPTSIGGLQGRGAGRGGVVSAFSLINPNDIESIDVLKDADATAIYGSRGANGVILITTKKGGISEPKLDLNIQHGIGEVAKRRKMLTTPEYLQMRKEAFANDGINPQVDGVFDPGYAPDLLLWNQNVYTDWQKEFLKTSGYTNLHGSVSGGTQNSSYMISGNYNRQTLVFPGDDKISSGRIHFSLSNTSANGKFRSILTGAYTTDKSLVTAQNFATFLDLPPNAPNPLNSDGTYNWALDPKSGITTWRDRLNPYAFSRGENSDTRNTSLLGTLDLTYSIIPGLDIKMTASINNINTNIFNGRLIAGLEPIRASTGTASANHNNIKNVAWQVEPMITYRKQIGRSDFSAILGSTLISKDYNSQNMGISNIKDDAYVRNPGSGTSTTFGIGGAYRYTAYYGRLSYIFANRYLLNTTLRKDGSSRFGPNRQFENFGAIGAGWVFSEESFMKSNFSFLSFGKIRASWGVTGNDQIGDYRYLDTYNFRSNIGILPANYQGVRPLTVQGLYNPNYSWERTTKKELGIEIGLSNDRILASASWFENKSDNQLLTNVLPIYVGFSSVIGNLPANMSNTGREYTLTSQNFVTKKFQWTTTLNLSFLRNRIVSFNAEAESFGNNSFYEILAKEGKSIMTMPLVKVLGVDVENGNYLFADIEGNPVDADGAVDAESVLLDPMPKYSGGLSNTIRFKNLQLDFSLQFVKQIGRNSLFNENWKPGSMANQDRSILGRWTGVGDAAQNRKFSQYRFDSHNQRDYERYFSSDAYYSDASFIRCNNVSIAWTLPQKMQKNAKLKNANIFVRGQNLFTITNYKGWDPENQTLSNIPPLRIISAGFQLTL